MHSIYNAVNAFYIAFVFLTRRWSYELLQDVLTGLPNILRTGDNKQEDKYKLAVAAGFFYKFFHGVEIEMVSFKA